MTSMQTVVNPFRLFTHLGYYLAYEQVFESYFRFSNFELNEKLDSSRY